MSDIKGKIDCPLCHGTGYKEGSWGAKVVCDCVVEQLNAQDEGLPDNAEVTSILLTHSDTNAKLEPLIENNVLTVEDLNLEYNREYALRSLSERCETLHLKISKQMALECLDVMDEILANIRFGKLPTKSYAIGIENGIGKTTYAKTLIKLAAKQDLSVVPYIDCSILAEKYIRYSKQLKAKYNNMIKGIEDETTVIKETYDWSKYVEADLAILSLSGGSADIAYVELSTLITLLSKRADRHRPTIVLMRTPVSYYSKFDEVRSYLLKELFVFKGKSGTYKMLEPYNLFTKEPTD